MAENFVAGNLVYLSREIVGDGPTALYRTNQYWFHSGLRAAYRPFGLTALKKISAVFVMSSLLWSLYPAMFGMLC